MAKIVIGVGSSHGPSIQSTPQHWKKLADGDTRDPRFDYQTLLAAARPGLDKEVEPELQAARHKAGRAALQTLVDRLKQAKPDVMLVVSNPHRIRPAEPHPVFGVLRAESFPVIKRSDQPFDPDSRFVDEGKRDKPKSVVERAGHPELANHLIDRLIGDGFDIACVDRLPEGVPLDDAFTFTYDWLFGELSVPMVPFMLSRDLPNQATPRRCYELGKAIGKAIAEWPSDLRVGLAASGGLSHQIVDEELDQQVVRALQASDGEALSALPRARLNGAPGTPEILNWIVLSAALAPTPMTLEGYLPCYRSVAGTGHGLAFGSWLA